MLLTVSDLMMLFGWRPKVKFGKFEQIKVEAENDWHEGKDADANPYKKGTLEHDVWYRQWRECNRLC